MNFHFDQNELTLKIFGLSRKYLQLKEIFLNSSPQKTTPKNCAKNRIQKKMKRKFVDTETSNQPKQKKRKLTKQVNDTSLVYDEEVFCNKLTVPIINSLSSGALYEKYKKSMEYFSKNKKQIVENNLGRWFGVYYKNNKPIIVSGRSRRNIMNKCPASSVISFGTFRDHVFIRKSVKYYRSFSNQNIPKNKNRPQNTKVYLSVLDPVCQIKVP